MKKYIICLLGFFYISLSCYSVEIQKIVPIVSDTHLKIEIYVKGEKSEKFSIDASILSEDNSSVLWENSLGEYSLKNTTDTLIVAKIVDIKPKLWSTVDPQLYKLNVISGKSKTSQRIGFRKFEMKDGHFYLNGKPIYLRGNAINPPERGIPKKLEESKEFAREYVRFMKSININIIRIPDNQNWMDVCDEEGMMIFAGRYGRPKNATSDAPPTDFNLSVQTYKNIDLGSFTPHPSVVIYILSNEMPYTGKAGDLYRNFLDKMHKELLNWDNTRLYICNAGYGLGKSADIYDVHRYWGWYYNTFLTYLNMRDTDMWQNEGKIQPITFTECVGNYTGIDGRFNLCSRTKQPGSQKSWTGHLPDDQQADAALTYQAFVMKNATEMFRRLRKENNRLAGTMPFSIIFHNWDGINSFSDMKPKPAAYQYKTSYQPILLSWENWQTQLFAGKDLSVIAHIVNDDEHGKDLKNAVMEWQLSNDDHTVVSGEIKIPEVLYYSTAEIPLNIPLPSSLSTGYYKLKGKVLSQGKVVSLNDSEIFVAGHNWKNTIEQKKKIYVYDKSEKTHKTLFDIGYKVEKTDLNKKLDDRSILIIGEECWENSLNEKSKMLSDFVKNGGRVICLKQDHKTFNTEWLPTNVEMLTESCNSPEYLSPTYTYMDGMNVNMERPYHPVFKGLSPDLFRLWSDYTDFDESKQGFPKIYPVTNGFDMTKSDLSKVAILSNYSRGLAATGLTEMFSGKGSVLLSGFDLINRIDKDPIAQRLLVNMINYMNYDNNHSVHVEISKPIIWGDYASERGIVTGAYNGLILNTKPIVPDELKEKNPLKVDKLGYQFVGSYGGWNSRPGIQYVPDGRRAIAPFTFSQGGNTLIDEKTSDGEGFFFVSVPSSAKTMYTTFENVVDEPLQMTISVDDEIKQTYTIPPHTTTEVKTELPKNNKNLKIHFKGSRQLVIKSTDFR